MQHNAVLAIFLGHLGIEIQMIKKYKYQREIIWLGNQLGQSLLLTIFTFHEGPQCLTWGPARSPLVFQACLTFGFLSWAQGQECAKRRKRKTVGYICTSHICQKTSCFQLHYRHRCLSVFHFCSDWVETLNLRAPTEFNLSKLLLAAAVPVAAAAADEDKISKLSGNVAPSPQQESGANTRPVTKC